MPYIRQKRRPFRLAPYASQSTYPALHDDALLRTTCCLYRPAPCSAHVRKRKIYSPLIRRIRPSAKFNREPCRKKTRTKQGEAPDKILCRKILRPNRHGVSAARATHKILRFKIPSHKILRYEISPTKFYVAKSRAVNFKSGSCCKISRA